LEISAFPETRKFPTTHGKAIAFPIRNNAETRGKEISSTRKDIAVRMATRLRSNLDRCDSDHKKSSVSAKGKSEERDGFRAKVAYDPLASRVFRGMAVSRSISRKDVGHEHEPSPTDAA
ncbi:hypothetical protein, partial [Streptomyces roseolilacinus]|uniref:hypothetical protein n=1 Tax=Streptomyces roseolilacinus TaxID=66904 RepID=UPI0038191CF5